MNEFMKVLFSLSISGTFLTAFMLLLAPVLQKTVGKTARYYIWLIVLLRFLVPVTFEASIVNYIFGLGTTEAAVQTENPFKDMGLQEEESDSVAITAEEVIPKPSKGLYAWAGERTLFSVWLFVFAFLIIKKMVQYARYSKRMRARAVPVLDAGLLAVLEGERKKRHMLLRFITAGNTKCAEAMLTLSENGEQVKERLGAIMQDKKRKGGSVISAIAAVLVLSMALGLGGYATKSFAEEKNEQDIVYYDYYMSTYFRGEYLISLGADLPEKAKQTFETNWELTLDDGQEVTLYFPSELSAYADNEAVMEAIKEAANTLAKDMKKSRKSVSSIGIREIEGPFTGTPKQLAAQFYAEDKIAGFQAVAGNLEQKELEQYWKLFYKELDYAYFSTVLEYIPQEDQKQIAEQSYEENEYAYFAMVLPYLPKEEQRKIAEQSYEDDNYGYFSLLVDEMNEDQRKEWLERADKDEKIEYRNIIETAE